MLPLCPASGFLTALACCLPPSPATGQPNKAPCLLQKVGQGTVNTVPLNLPPSRRHQSHPPGGSVFTPKHKAAPPLTAAREQCLCKKSFCANTPKTAMAFCSCCFCHRHCSLVITSLAPALLRVCCVPLGSTWLWALEWFTCCLVAKSHPTLL